MTARPGSAGRSPLRRRLGTVARVAFGLAGLTFLVVAFARTWDRAAEQVVPAPWRLTAALVCITVAMSLAYKAWAQLFERPVRSRPFAAGFFLSQLGKYVPGAIWQAVGQVGYATRAEVSLGRAATTFAVFALTQAVAGALVGLGAAVLVPGLAWWLRVGALGAGGLLLLLDRRWMVWAVGVYRRRRPGGTPAQADGGAEPLEDVVPAQGAILRSCAWSVGVMLAMGATFVVLLGGLGASVPVGAAVTAHALAWTVGFLALPFPSGIGVREVGLIALLGPMGGTAPLIAASVYFRLAQMLAEALLILVTRDWRRRRSPARR